MIVVFIFFLSNINQKVCYADSIEISLLENIEGQLEKLDLTEIERYILSLTSENQGLFEGSF